MPSVRAVRWVRFNVVGVAGFLIQLGVLWLLVSRAGIPYWLAGLVAIEAAILHNFAWHMAWTWADRPAPRGGVLRCLGRFHAGAAAVSFSGHLLFTVALVELAHFDYRLASALGTIAGSLASFALADRLVFARTVSAAFVLAAAVAPARAAELRPATAAAFDRYVRLTEARLDAEKDGREPFLWLDRLNADERREVLARLERGDVFVTRMPTRRNGHLLEIPDGLGHHWLGTVIVRGVSAGEVERLLQAYDRYAEVYRPMVRRSRTLERNAGRFRVHLQLFMKKGVSVVLNTESVVEYLPISSRRVQVRSRSTRIAQVRDAGGPAEREAPVGEDDGYLWRFNNYCALEEREADTYVQCETVSLSRDVPLGLGWLLGPIVSRLPRDTLELTLDAIRRALVSSGSDRSAARVEAPAMRPAAAH